MGGKPTTGWRILPGFPALGLASAGITQGASQVSASRVGCPARTPSCVFDASRISYEMGWWTDIE
jgi:hypothetical protein